MYPGSVINPVSPLSHERSMGALQKMLHYSQYIFRASNKPVNS